MAQQQHQQQVGFQMSPAGGGLPLFQPFPPMMMANPMMSAAASQGFPSQSPPAAAAAHQQAGRTNTQQA